MILPVVDCRAVALHMCRADSSPTGSFRFLVWNKSGRVGRSDNWQAAYYWIKKVQLRVQRPTDRIEPGGAVGLKTKPQAAQGTAPPSRQTAHPDQLLAAD